MRPNTPTRREPLSASLASVPDASVGRHQCVAFGVTRPGAGTASPAMTMRPTAERSTERGAPPPPAELALSLCARVVSAVPERVRFPRNQEILPLARSRIPRYAAVVPLGLESAWLKSIASRSRESPSSPQTSTMRHLGARPLPVASASTVASDAGRSGRLPTMLQTSFTPAVGAFSAAIGQDQLRGLVSGLSAETTQADIRTRLAELRELGYSERRGWYRIWAYRSLRSGPGWDATVLLTFRNDGRLLFMESYYPTSAQGPMRGIPVEQCFVPGECGPELYAFGRPTPAPTQ